jgi:lipid II:glycine glycyltransferase (peptidoglycan interpeptide bridge formation enzyme)
LDSPPDGLTWNHWISALPGAHILQTWEWGQVKSRFGWQPVTQVWRDRDGELTAAALILSRALPIAGFSARLKVFYIPKGPLLRDWGDPVLRLRVLQDLQALAERQGAIFIKIDPEVPLEERSAFSEVGRGDAIGQALAADLEKSGWLFSGEQVQFRSTVLVDLAAPEEELLARMKAKTRYNIRLAGRKGVQVRAGTEADFGLLYRMYAETSLRDGFAIRDEGYYRDVWGTFLRSGLAVPLVAEVSGEPVAAVVIFVFSGKAWYLYGMSREIHRDKMPNHLLQWEAIRWAKASGCSCYDLWGAPDRFDESDRLWGVYRFKEGLGGRVVRHIGAWDLPIRPSYYRLYTELLPRLLDWMRRRGIRRTRQSLASLV